MAAYRERSTCPSAQRGGGEKSYLPMDEDGVGASALMLLEMDEMARGHIPEEQQG